MEKKNIYSIRKSKVGAVSTKIAAVVFLALAGGVALNSTQAHAAEETSAVAEDYEPVTVIDPDVHLLTEETTIKSPVEYTADPTKEVGTKEVVKEGTDGKLVTVDEGISVVKRTEPTPTKVTLGTKPKVETIITEKAKTEYVEDKNLEAGKQEVVRKAQDASTTTTTTYKIVTTPKVDLGRDVEDALKSDKYMYTDEKLYSVDESKELPSDKIKIDKLFVGFDKNKKFDRPTSAREFIARGYLDLDGEMSIITPEMLNPDNKDVRKFQVNYSYKKLSDESYAGGVWDFSKDKDFYEALAIRSSANILRLSNGKYITQDLYDGNIYDSTTKVIKEYNAKHVLTEAMYADSKANYERMNLAINELKKIGEYENIIPEMKNRLEWAETAFKSITQHYNNLNGYSNTFKPSYKGDISEKFKKELEEDIAKLPYEIRKNLVQLLITTDELPPAAKTDNPIGLAYSLMRNIEMNYDEKRERIVLDKNGVVLDENGKEKKVIAPYTREQNRSVLLHELSHIIDYNSGFGALIEVIDSFGNIGGIQLGLSTTKEYKDLYDNYLKAATNLGKYYSKNIEESFAEGLGEYLNKKLFGTAYNRYRKIGDKIYTIFPGEEGYENETTVWDNPEVEGYFATLYTKLFEQPTVANVVVNTIKTTTTPLQNGLIKVGTKTSQSNTAGWKKEGGAWYYKKADGSNATNTWVQGNYYVKADGKMATNEWFKVGNTTYYAKSNGEYAKSTWVGDKYVKATGAMAKNEWIKVGTTWYYTKDNGTYAANTWVQGKYYVKSNGAMAKNEWFKVGNTTYYAKSNGEYAANTWVGDKYVKATGAMAKNEWIKVGTTWYYAKDNGTYAANTWVQGKYYVKSNGVMATNEWFKVGNTTYYAKSNGEYAANTWVGDKYVKATGAMAKNEWVKVGTTWYYLKADGSYARNEFQGNYFLKSNGVMAKNEYFDYNNKDYYADENGLSREIVYEVVPESVRI